jgi:hypothetical protein
MNNEIATFIDTLCITGLNMAIHRCKTADRKLKNVVIIENSVKFVDRKSWSVDEKLYRSCKTRQERTSSRRSDTHEQCVLAFLLGKQLLLRSVPLALSRIEHHGKLVKTKSDRLLLIVIGLLFDLNVVSSSVSSSWLRHRVEDGTYFQVL